MSWIVAIAVLNLGFILGCVWNGRAYERGFDDALETLARRRRTAERAARGDR